MRVLSVKFGPVEITNTFNSSRAFQNSSTEYKYISQVLEDSVSQDILLLLRCIESTESRKFIVG